jgi:hypothetical protein
VKRSAYLATIRTNSALEFTHLHTPKPPPFHKPLVRLKDAQLSGWSNISRFAHYFLCRVVWMKTFRLCLYPTEGSAVGDNANTTDLHLLTFAEGSFVI